MFQWQFLEVDHPKNSRTIPDFDTATKFLENYFHFISQNDSNKQTVIQIAPSEENLLNDDKYINLNNYFEEPRNNESDSLMVIFFYMVKEIDYLILL